MAIRLQSFGSNKVLLKMVMNVSVRKNAGNLLTKALEPLLKNFATWS